MALAQTMQNFGRLAGAVAHDFNNLLTVINSFTRFVMDDLGSEDPRHADLGEVLTASARATKLTHQLLAFSSKQPGQPLLTDLNASITRFASVLKRTLAESIQLRVIENSDSVCVMSGPDTLDQLMLNLTANACDAMPTGGTLTIEIGRRMLGKHHELPPGEYAAIDIADTGPGMSPEVMGQIFEPFFSTKREQGTGLGLATCYGLVKQANGHIDVESHVGLGSKFSVLLPLVPTPAKQISVAPASLIERSAVSSLALLVEDQAPIRRAMSRSLQRAGFNVIDVQSAEEALAVLEDLKAPIDLLVTDIVLPGLDGIQLALQLRTGRPDLRVLVCSGYAGDAEANALTADRRTAFLPKPFAGIDLAAAAVALFK
jgi:CheY-like chemotaxis protein